MEDPLPENIDGQKQHVVSHSMEHRVNYSHVVIAALAVFAIWYFDPIGKLEERSDSERGAT